MDERPGFVLVRVQGRRAAAAFAHETGGHRFQRVPPTEKRGRVHTSTVTVAVLEPPREHELHIDPRDIDETFTRGSGKGGQHRNKTETCVVLVHRPTGVRVRLDGGRQRELNRQNAFAILAARLRARQREQAADSRNANRREQVGSGMRGDKVRTIAMQRDTVTDHRTGRTIPVKDYVRGKLDGLWSANDA